MGNKKTVIFNSIFFIVLFTLTTYMVLKGNELPQILKVLKSTNPVYYLLGFAAIIIFVCCESYIIHRMLNVLGYNISANHCVKYSFVGFFFSCITPSATGGQPAQLYYMKRDNIGFSVSTVVLMIVTILYKSVLVFLGLMIIFFNHSLITDYIKDVNFFFYFGLLLNAGFIAAMLILLFEPTLASRILFKLTKLCEKVRILKKRASRRQKQKESMERYHNTASVISENKFLILEMFVVTLFQRILHFSITYIVYRSFGLNTLSFIDVVSLQCIISIAVDMLPLPGGMGISEGLFLSIFKKIFTGSLLYPAMLLSRGISYYLLVLVSALMTIAAHMTIKDKRQIN